MPRTAIRYFTPAGRSKGGFVRLTSGVASTAFVLTAFRTRCLGFACICSTAVVVDAIAMATCGSQASVPRRPFHSRRSTLLSRSLSKISIGRVKSGRPSSQPHHNALSPLAGVRGVDQSESTSCHEPYFSTNEDGANQAGFDHVRFPHAPPSSPSFVRRTSFPYAYPRGVLEAGRGSRWLLISPLVPSIRLSDWAVFERRSEGQHLDRC